MAHPTTFNVCLSEQLGAFVASNIGDDGLHESASAYFSDLIRQDQARLDEERFQALKAELQAAFAVPDSALKAITAEEFIARAKSRMVRAMSGSRTTPRPRSKTSISTPHADGTRRRPRTISTV